MREEGLLCKGMCQLEFVPLILLWVSERLWEEQEGGLCARGGLRDDSQRLNFCFVRIGDRF